MRKKLDISLIFFFVLHYIHITSIKVLLILVLLIKCILYYLQLEN
jgi:hypothetical protein